MEIRHPGPDVVDPLLEFFERIPAAERTFFKESVLDRETVAGWTGGARGLACARGEIAGYVAVVPLGGWSDHVGELRLVVAPGWRRQGVGRRLARWALLQAIELGLQKVYVEVATGSCATSC
jgi:GNAT superfamily N-acetyltransferase